MAKILSFFERYWWWLMIPVAGIAYGLAMIMAIGEPIWFDENYSILLAKSSVSDLLSLTAVDAHPPLYYLLLKLWGSIFGFGEFALRSLSAVLFGGAIIVALSLIRKVFSTKVALITVPFLVVAPFLLRYGYEVRMYALATLIAISATYALVQAWTTNAKRWWVVYALLVAAGMYTLYLIAAVWLAHVIWLLVQSVRSKERPFWRWTWLYAIAGAIVVFAPYIPTFFHQFFNSALPGIGQQITPTQLVNVISMLTVYTPEWALVGASTFILVTLSIVFGVFGVQGYKTLAKAQRPIFWLLVTLAVVPIIFFALTSISPDKPIFTVRYMAHVAIFIYLLAGLSVALAWSSKKLRKRVLVSGTALVIGVFGFGAYMLASTGNFNFERLQHPSTVHVREAAACDAETIVVADDPYTYIDSEFYFQDCDLRFFAQENIERAGGYARLHDSVDRISVAGAVSSNTLIHLRWNGNDPSFAPDVRYELVSTEVFDKQVVDTYKLIAE